MSPPERYEGQIRSWIRTELWNQVPVRIAVIDRDYRVVEANRAFRRSFGHWEGKRCYEAYKGLSERCDRCAAAKTLDDGIIRRRQECGRDRDGQEVWYWVQSVPFMHRDGSIPFIIEMSTDITETKRLEREMLVAERLAAVGQTVAGLAHGVKNLLMGLEGGMYIARSGIERSDPERLLEGWTILEDGVERISAFVKEFLEFARGSTPYVELTDPNAVAREVVELFKGSAEQSGITLALDMAEGIAAAPLDREGIHTCLANLISNALDACQTSDGPPGEVTLTTREVDGSIVYEVQDDGHGMDYEVKQKVFTNFFSTKASGKGTGLGLLTTRKIVQEHGGRVSVESRPGEGSTFRLEFPRRRLPQVSEETGEGASGNGSQLSEAERR